MISATGRMPAMAAPTAAPTMACSLIGVARTRSVPYLVDNPADTLNTPPLGSAMSSPSRNTEGSRARASSRALPIAWNPSIGTVSWLISDPFVDVGQQFGKVGQRTGLGELECVGDL